MSVEAHLQDLRDSGRAAREAGDAVGRTTPGESLRAAAAAIPGAGAEASISAVSARWPETLKGWADGARRYGDALQSCADTYAAHDEAARRAFER
ncbi:MAG: hypothetical protein LWW86_04265 [Micrococcales bacterium]|nr:hypothetical protein [Micrococcales bacterium]